MSDALAIRLFVGGHAWSVQGERQDLSGHRMFTAGHSPPPYVRPEGLRAMLDSGAFSDDPARRLDPEQALERQLRWEKAACERWCADWLAAALASYDVLIDETWTNGVRHKRRWSIRDADHAVHQTVEAAHYLSSQRERLASRRLVLSAQGVDALQYAECTAGVLQAAQPGDVFGLGGWCILGRQTTLLPEFWATLRLVLPMVAYAGLTDVHIFGVLYLPALGGLLWLADQYGLAVSTDFTAPMLSCTRGNAKKAGVRHPYWRENVRWWQHTLATLRHSDYYREPPDIPALRQLTLLEDV